MGLLHCFFYAAMTEAILIGKQRWETPDEMTRYIHEKLSPRVRAKNEVLLVNHVTAVHDFQQWLDPLGVAHALVLKRIDNSLKFCAVVCIF